MTSSEFFSAALGGPIGRHISTAHLTLFTVRSSRFTLLSEQLRLRTLVHNEWEGDADSVANADEHHAHVRSMQRSSVSDRTS